MGNQADEDVVTQLTAAAKGSGANDFTPSVHFTLLLKARDEIDRLRDELKEAQRRSFQDGRICYRGFSYGVGSQWGIDSLRSAIRGNGHD